MAASPVCCGAMADSSLVSTARAPVADDEEASLETASQQPPPQHQDEEGRPQWEQLEPHLALISCLGT